MRRNKWFCRSCIEQIPYARWSRSGGFAYATCPKCGTSKLTDLETRQEAEPYKINLPKLALK